MICNTLGRMCDQRRQWQQSGEMYFRDHHTHGGTMSGWVFPANRFTPQMNPGFYWDFCPACFGTLPNLEHMCDKLKRQDAAWKRLLQEIRAQERLPDWLRKVPPKEWPEKPTDWQADGEGDE
jgi:hypothetical protein